MRALPPTRCINAWRSRRFPRRERERERERDLSRIIRAERVVEIETDPRGCSVRRAKARARGTAPRSDLAARFHGEIHEYARRVPSSQTADESLPEQGRIARRSPRLSSLAGRPFFTKSLSFSERLFPLLPSSCRSFRSASPPSFPLFPPSLPSPPRSPLFFLF